MSFLIRLLLSATLFATDHKKMIIVGDSLTEGFGVSKAQAYPAKLEARLKAEGKGWEVVNSGISGSTSAGARARTLWALKQKPDLLVLALGANDGLRGLPVKELERNLSDALDACASAHVRAVLVGMKMPPNLGKAYTESFAAVYPRVAKSKHVLLVPFLLENVAGKSNLNQGDGVHPNAEGHTILAETLYQGLKDIL